MFKQFGYLLLFAGSFAICAYAQNTFPATGNAGIGTTNPDRELKIQPASDNQTILSIVNSGNTAEIFTAGDDSSGNGSVNIRNSSNKSQVLLNSNGVSYINGGNLGIGTTNPALALDIVSGSSGNAPFLRLSNTSGSTAGSFGPGIFLNNGVFGTHSFILNQYQGVNSPFQISNGDAPFTPYFTITQSGAVGIGTISPGASLEVNGSVRLTANSGASVTFADGTVQSTAWSGTLCGGDYAESVDVSGDKTNYEPGDVLVVNEGDRGDVVKSTQPYSTLVAGIYSTKPGVLGRRQTTPSRDTEIPMAMVGIVPTKVSAENGAIKKGDLLVTSSTMGYAMKGTDSSRMLGAIVGKALGNLDAGTGVIEVLVSLQ